MSDIFCSKSKILEATDGFIYPNYKIRNGTYAINYHNTYILFIISDDGIEIVSFANNIEILKQFINNVYCKYGSSEKLTIFRTSNGKTWNHPIFGRPRNIRMTPEMLNMFEDLEQFLTENTESIYKEEGRIYKRTYFIEGPSGTGKSSIIEKIAKEKGMDVYMVHLNSNNFTDSDLIYLVGSVPRRSIIVFDELEKQYQSLMNNNSTHITIGGILSAMDGPQRLPDSTVMIITVNNINILENDFKDALLRNGRVDKYYKFTEKIL